MIRIQNLSKMFRAYPKRSDRIKEWLTLGKKRYHKEHWVLKDINFSVKPGEVFGLIGMNGAGKSTLLKIITSTLAQTSGTVTINGRIAALLELGTGFHSELTGRENVIINARIHGLSESEIKNKIEEISAFAELDSYFDEPIRTYSSGMYVRLAFSLAISVDPDILIIDEALSVGDAYFQQKCIHKISEFKRKGVTILFVSHDPGAVKLLCDRAALLKEGSLIAIGEPWQMLEKYNSLIARMEGVGQEYFSAHKDGFGNQIYQSGNRKAEILGVELRDTHGGYLSSVEAGTKCEILVRVRFNETLENPTVGILIRDRLGYDVFGTNTAQMDTYTGKFTKGDETCFKFNLEMNIGAGDYTFTVALHSSTTHVEDCYEWADRILTFKVLPKTDYQFIGVSMLRPSFSKESYPRQL